MIKWFKRKNRDITHDGEEGPPGSLLAPETDEYEAVEPDGTIEVEEHMEPPEPNGGTNEEESSSSVDHEAEDEQLAGREKGRYFKRLRERLHKTREQFADRVDRIVLGKKTIDADVLDELEEVLITSDLGVKTTSILLEKVAERIRRQELRNPEKLREHLRQEIQNILATPASPWDLTSKRPFVVMIIGVNGVGKTTTIGKLAHDLKQNGHKVMLVAGDTFRAAAIEQLVLWGERVNVPVIRQKSGSDPSAVAFDAMDAAVSRDVDVVLIDTAGRMHTKVNLMEELKKVRRVIQKKMPEAPHETLLVLDASTGQNALSQVRLFKDEMGITGLILTKLDGTAKGGIIVAISQELQLPVRYIGIGEGLDDLRPFDPGEFTKALL